MKKTILLFATLALSVCAFAQTWVMPLYLDGGKPFTKRVMVEIENKSKTDSEGNLLHLPAKDLGIVGMLPHQIRVVGENKRELMFDITPITDGKVSDNSFLVIPVECKAGKKTQTWIYFNNRHAWELPTNLKVDLGTSENFESAKSVPIKEWGQYDNDDEHVNSIDSSKAKSGKKSLMTSIKEGAKPNWVCINRRFDVSKGDKYKISGWVAGENLKGNAGYYLHVGDKKNSTYTPYTGTFDWKEIKFEGEVPEGAKYIQVGTVARASGGKAWFDDIKVEITPSTGEFSYKISEQEKLEYKKLKRNKNWEVPVTKYPSRIIASSCNFSDNDIENGLCTLPVNRITNANYTPETFVLYVDGKKTPFILSSGNMIFESGNIPAHSEKFFSVYINKDKKNQKTKATIKQESGILSDYELNPSNTAKVEEYATILNSSVNLLKNPSFEKGLENWNKSDAKGVKIEVIDGGIIGDKMIKMEIEKSAEGNWYGLRQSVPAKGMQNYIIMGWAKNLSDKAAAVNAHRRTNGVKGFEAYSSALIGNDWQLFSMLTMGQGTGAVDVHLTDTKGAYLYDGILIAPCSQANLSKIESAADNSDDGFNAWQVDTLVKVFETDAPIKTDAFNIAMAANEDEGMQIAIRSSKDIENIEVTATAPVLKQGMLKNLFGGEKPSLKAPEIGHINSVIIDTESRYFHFTDLKPYERFVPTGVYAQMYPDPIMPESKFNLDGKKTKGIFLNFNTPKDAKSGIYEGEIEIKSDGKTLKKIPYTVRVYSFSLADNPILPAIFDVRAGAGSKYKDYTNVDAARYMASKKLSVDTIPASPKFKEENGKITADFTEFDKYAEVYLNELKFPYLYLPFRGGSFGWANPPAPYMGENPYAGKWPYTDADHSVLNPKYRAKIIETLKLFSAHLKEKGWENRFMFYISDEPFAKRPEIEAQMKALCDMIHEGAPKIKIYCSTWYYVPSWKGKLDIWGVGAQGQTSEAEIKEIIDSGFDIITTTDGQLALDCPYNAIERLLPLYCYKYGFKGYEFWGADWYTLNPLKWGLHRDIPQSDTPGIHYRVRYPNGDGYIFYPGKLIGKSGTIFGSVRMEAHRDGVEDYEYFVLLEKLAKAKNDKPALDALERLKKFAFIPNAGGRNAVMLLPNPLDYSALRREIAEHIERLQ